MDKDSARSIRDFTRGKIATRIEKEADALPLTELANLHGGFVKIVAEYPDEDQVIGEAERDRARDYMVGIVSAVLASAGITLDDVAQRVDAALVHPTNNAALPESTSETAMTVTGKRTR